MQAPLSEMPKIAGLIVARDEADTIASSLASLQGVDALWVVDNESTDATGARARAAGARVVVSAENNMGRLRQFAMEQIDADWVIMLDADERLPADGLARIRAAIQGADASIAAFTLPIRTFLGPTWLRWGGYHPAARPRVFRVGAVSWPAARVHERPQCAGRLMRLSVELTHESYRDFAEARAKTRRYAWRAALDDRDRGRRRGTLATGVRVAWRFLRVLLVRHGWLMGRLGWRLACLQAQGVWWRYRGGPPTELRDR